MNEVAILIAAGFAAGWLTRGAIRAAILLSLSREKRRKKLAELEELLADGDEISTPLKFVGMIGALAMKSIVPALAIGLWWAVTR